MILNAIKLNPQLHQEHQRVLLRYLRDERTLSHHDWAMLSEAVDALMETARLGATISKRRERQ
jgi:hypothetical protein